MSHNESVTKDDLFIAVSLSPDACRTPPQQAAVPYQITAKLGGALSVSPDVKYNGRPVILADESSIPQVVGDEAGTGGGVKSGTCRGPVRFPQGSGSVKANGRPIVRVKDPVAMNGGNTTGRIQSMKFAAPASGITPEGRPGQPSNPPVRLPPRRPTPKQPRPGSVMDLQNKARLPIAGATVVVSDTVVFHGTGEVCASREPAPPLRKAIPVILVPGIMGSNIQVRKESEAEVKRRFEEDGRLDEYRKKVWEAPNLFYSGKELVKQLWIEVGDKDCDTVQTSKKWERYGPKFRQIMLNPKTTEVDEGGFIPDTLPEIDGRKGKSVAFERGWGTVHWDSYGGLLTYLQRQLNPSSYQSKLSESCRKGFLETYPPLNQAFRLFGDLAPTEWGIENASKFCYPVFAGGYNWTQSNVDSAKALLAQIELWIKRLEQVDHFACSQVILVTHSMGGLVARIANELDKAGKNRIMGVIHGVMPATGAPVLYRRLVGGTEKDRKAEVFPHLQDSFRKMAGRIPAETTPVIANSPGCLELLPSHLYPPGWLKIKKEDSVGDIKEEFSLPTAGNPYREIYKVNDKSYRMVDPALLDPASLHSIKETKREIAQDAWKSYVKRIDKVEVVHKQYLGQANYHKHTYAFYGTHLPTFRSVHWRIPRTHREFSGYDSPFPRDIPRNQRKEEPLVQSQIIRGGILEPFPSEAPRQLDGQGDGTVPEESGHAPKGRIYRLCPFKDLEHADAYNSLPARAFTVLAICKLVAHSKIKAGAQ